MKKDGHLLAFDTSTESMSIALRVAANASGFTYFEFSGVGGQAASATLLPAIQGLMTQAQLQFKDLSGIAFGAGPGAFTGLRAACAVAQGLGLAADVPVLPINCLHAIALGALSSMPSTTDTLVAVLDARMGERYWQIYQRRERHLIAVNEAQVTTPQAIVYPPHALVIEGAQPSARVMLELAAAMLADGLAVTPSQALPLYVRNKVAMTTQERLDAQAATP